MPQFLVYIPSVDKYATLFMGSKTSRRVAPDLKAILDSGMKQGVIKAATLRNQLIKDKRGRSWHGIVVTTCSQPLTFPSQEEMVGIINGFNNPPEKDTEAAPSEDGEDRPR